MSSPSSLGAVPALAGFFAAFGAAFATMAILYLDVMYQWFMEPWRCHSRPFLPLFLPLILPCRDWFANARGAEAGLTVMLWLLGQGLQTAFPQLLKLKILVYVPPQ